jgi:hypothetical protein
MKTPQALIIDAARISEFLKDPAVKEAFDILERKYHEEFIAEGGKSSETRIICWAKQTVLRDFKKQLVTVCDAGEREVMVAAKPHLAPRT